MRTSGPLESKVCARTGMLLWWGLRPPLPLLRPRWRFICGPGLIFGFEGSSFHKCTSGFKGRRAPLCRGQPGADGKLLPMPPLVVRANPRFPRANVAAKLVPLGNQSKHFLLLRRVATGPGPAQRQAALDPREVAAPPDGAQAAANQAG